ncbi:MAG: cytochrome c oxidase accessory protein CcoG [Pseudomonadota bacterium]
MAGPLPTPVVTDDGEMYQSAAKIYPHEVDGRFQRLRKAAVFWLLGMFYLFPWLSWDGRQAVLFDLPARQFHVFGLTFWPQDFIYLSMLLMMAAFALFFFTALAGRLWCGYACPQTVWSETFLWIERWTEGSRNQRMKLDAAPMSWDKFRRKASKQFLWIAFAAWTGFTFVGFFTPVRELGASLLALEVGPWEGFWMLFYGAATYGNAGYLREQVCKYMCPYARFQGAMFDRNTLVISYDAARGEPRGARKRSADPRSLGLGDCIDCTVCVQVCPTGIDIRNGLQYECIACGACIDACDEVMDKMGYPRGLVRYSTQNAIDGKPSRVLRPRVLIYSAILLLLAGGFVVSLAARVPLAVDVLRDRNALYREAPTGYENAYTLKVMNKDRHPHRFEIAVESSVPLAISTPLGAHARGDDRDDDDSANGRRLRHFEVDAQALRVLPVTLTAAPGAARGRVEIVFVVTRESDHGVAYRQKSAFFAPP